MKLFIRKILSGEHLSIDEAKTAMTTIMNGEATPAQIAGFLIALKTKGVTAQEVAGLVSVMKDNAVRIELDDPLAVDGCGTGGDGGHTFNISTAASLVAAGAGVTVAKHGNRSVSSRCGSADLLEAAGGKIDADSQTVQRNINEVGFGFMFAPRFHPAMKHVAGPRQELGVRTVFNILGPMSNPALVTRQVIGVYDKALLSLMVEALELAGAEHVIVAHSHEGLDEFSVIGPTGYVELRGGRRSHAVISPEDVGLARYAPESLAGGDAEANLGILHRVLGGQKGACRDATVFNAGAMIYVGGKAASIGDGVKLAQQSIDSGNARAKLRAWVEASQT
ncbi:MAG: anthranilate phosphoribosyltransferase [bacterium]